MFVVMLNGALRCQQNSKMRDLFRVTALSVLTVEGIPPFPSAAIQKRVERARLNSWRGILYGRCFLGGFVFHLAGSAGFASGGFTIVWYLPSTMGFRSVDGSSQSSAFCSMRLMSLTRFQLNVT